MNTKTGYEIVRFESIPSTNDYAKERRGEEKDLLVIAKRQTSGRGTKGRSFSSSEGGLYLTALRFYEKFPANKAFEVMQHTAVAVCETLAHFSITAKIKWPNDIFVGDKKICGILIENVFSGNTLRSSCVGVGLNVNNLLEEELLSIATTMQTAIGAPIEITAVESRLIEKLFGENLSHKYATYLGWIGEKVKIRTADGELWVRLLGVNERGELLAKTKDGERAFSAGEVSVSV